MLALAGKVIADDMVYKDPNSGCWLWLGTINGGGYGSVGGPRAGREKMAHRIAYRNAYGDIPEGHVVRHKCDTKSCCNPNHLTTGTQQENINDMKHRGRGFRKLSLALAREIRDYPASSRKTGKVFGVDGSYVRWLRAGKVKSLEECKV